jgi:prepilin-type processing-associated H-X9-DG protein
LPAVQKVREAANRTRCISHLKQLGLAMHNYEGTFRAFPAGWYDNTASPPRPARNYVVDLLSYIEQDNLARLYSTASDWDNAANAAAIAYDIPILVCPSAPGRAGLAVCDYPIVEIVAFDAFTGLGIPPSTPQSQYAGFHFGSGMPTRIADVSDGLSNTFMIYEDAGRPQYWVAGTQQTPGSGTVNGNEKWADPSNRITLEVWCGSTTINCHNANEIYSFHPGGANFAMGDGSVRFVAANIAPATFKAVYTRAGGEVIGADF